VRHLSGQLGKLIIAVQIVISDCEFLRYLLPHSCSSCAENLFLRKQLALFQEREKKAKATTAADRCVFSKLACLFDSRTALVIVKPSTLIGWHRTAFRRFWRSS
jgi:putative transposase